MRAAEFLLANSAAWLFVARAIQGVSTGAALSAASAALLDLHPRRDPAAAGLANGTAATAGVGLGILVSSSLVRIGWEPRVLPYALLLLLAAIAFSGAYWMPEPVPDRSRFRLTVQRPRVPSGVRPQFVLAGLAVLASWSIAALFFSLGPQLALQLFHSTNVIVSGIGIVALAGATTLAQLLTARIAPLVAASAGSIALAAGMVVIVLAAPTDSSVAYLVGSIVGRAGFGAAFLGGLRAVFAVIEPNQRAAVTAAFFVVAYASLSVPAVIAGVLVSHISSYRSVLTRRGSCPSPTSDSAAVSTNQTLLARRCRRADARLALIRPAAEARRGRSSLDVPASRPATGASVRSGPRPRDRRRPAAPLDK